MTGTILVVEDDQAYRTSVVRYLRRLHLKVLEAADIEQGIHCLDAYPVDVAILDIGLGKSIAINGKVTFDSKSGSSGYALIETVRSRPEYVSILVLTSLEEPIYEIAALQAGADKFLSKAVQLEVLAAHVKCCLRQLRAFSTLLPQNSAKERNGAGAGARDGVIFQAGDIHIDMEQQLIRIGSGEYIHLSAREVKLVQLLARNPGKVFGKHQLLEELWGKDATQGYDSVTALIKAVRRKVEPQPRAPRYILTVHGRGFRMNLSGYQILQG